jgi:hypothetical protein
LFDKTYSNADDSQINQVKYDPYTNRNQFIMWVYFMNIIAFLSFSLIHHLKAGDTKGFDKGKTIKKVKK